MKDPLTREEHWKFHQNFMNRYRENYQKALDSGAVSEEDLPEHDHTLARCIFIITAEDFTPLSPSGKEMLKNLEKFV
ncbi:hypothetical protein ES703_91027 [subsurface metagenome]